MRRVERIASKVLRSLKVRVTQSIEIVFIGDRAMRALNRRFKGRDRATDVLSFDLGGACSIVISSDSAARNCRIYGTTPGEELVLYVIHGILHYFGWRDGSARERAGMSKKEGSILRKLCANENLSKVLTPR